MGFKKKERKMCGGEKERKEGRMLASLIAPSWHTQITIAAVACIVIVIC